MPSAPKTLSGLLYSNGKLVRAGNRKAFEVRPVEITPDFISSAEGSALIRLGETRVICTASVDSGVPAFLKGTGKVKDPWPNVDAGSGSLLYLFGLTEFDYYTVLFGVSRALGMCSQLVLNRLLGTPITRPKSVSTDWVIKAATAAGAPAAQSAKK